MRRSRAGENDDGKFLVAIHHFTVHSITWRALPPEYGKWNSAWKRFWRLSRSVVFEAFFQMLAECSQTAHLIQFFDSTTARPRLSRRGERGQHRQALGCSRGGFSTKIHLKTDLDGNPLDFHLTGGEVSDSTQFEISLDIGPDIRPRIAMTDKGYDSQANRMATLARGIAPVIPRRENSKQRSRFFPKPLYKLRTRIEQTIGKLKRFKRVAMRRRTGPVLARWRNTSRPPNNVPQTYLHDQFVQSISRVDTHYHSRVNST